MRNKSGVQDLRPLQQCSVTSHANHNFSKHSTSSYCGLGSSDGIATDYGLDGLGLNPGGDEIFRPFRPALGPTQPPVK